MIDVRRVAPYLAFFAACRTDPEALPKTAAQAATERKDRQTVVATLATPASVANEPPLLGDDGQDVDGYPRRYVNRAALLRLLKDKNFDELEKRFEQYQADFESNPRNEYWAIDASGTFETADAELTPLLDAWVVASPNTFAPYVARAEHRFAIAWAKRGSKWAKDTHADDFREMEKVLPSVIEDVEKAKKLRSTAIAAMRTEIRTLRGVGDKNALERAAIAAEKACSECLEIRIAHITANQPRWGGSYQQMDKIAKSAPSNSNHRLGVLAGFAALDRANVFRFEDKLDDALKAIDLAIGQGDHWEFFEKRSQIRRLRHELEQALNDADRAVELRPGHPDPLFERARVHFALKSFEASGRDLRDALRADPTSIDGRNQLEGVVKGVVYDGWEMFKAGKKEDAIRAIDLALELSPNDADAQNRKKWIIGGQDGRNPSAETVAQLKENSESNPDDFRAVQRLDYALAKQRKFAEVVELWNGYLAKHPEDGKAYLERGGAHFHLGQKDDAFADANKACDLGVSEGCVQAKRNR